MNDVSDYTLEIWPNEYDKVFLSKLDRFLIREFDASREKDNWGRRGAPEMTRWEYRIAGRPVIVQAETYMGISLHGPRETVEAIAGKIRKAKTCGQSP